MRGLLAVSTCGKSYVKMLRRRLNVIKCLKPIIVIVIMLACIKSFLHLARDNLILKYPFPVNKASDSHFLADNHVETLQPWLRLLMDSPEYSRRINLANATCLRDGPGSAQKIVSDKEERMAYCIVPKAGSTFWINIFRFLHQSETGKTTYKHPMEIPRIVTHYGPKMAMKSVKKHDTPPPFAFNKTLRFMFVREPYSRLWSAWIDKFWLPDFWMVEAVKLAISLNLTRETISCPKNITFPMFLKYVTLESDPEIMNQHWAPYKHLCDPCLFRPHLIGKLETFAKDSRVILDAVNMTWVLNPPSRPLINQTGQQGVEARDRSMQEISMLTAYNVKIWSLRGLIIQACFPISELYQRLWKAFQYNGHLPEDVDIPAKFLQGNYTQQEFLDACNETYRAWNATSKIDMWKQKRAALVANYRDVSTDVKEKIQKMFAFDFEMFGYDAHPADIWQDK